MDEWISKMWSSHMMEYYPVSKRKAILTCAATLMSPEDIVLLSEIGQSQKDKYCVTPLLGGMQSIKITQAGKVEWRLPGAGKGRRRSCFMGLDSVLQKEKKSGDR